MAGERMECFLEGDKMPTGKLLTTFNKEVVENHGAYTFNSIFKDVRKTTEDELKELKIDYQVVDFGKQGYVYYVTIQF